MFPACRFVLRCVTFVRPVRLTTPSLSPVSPGSGDIATVNPFPDSSFAISISRQISAPRLGLCAPTDRSFHLATDREVHLPNASDCPLLPATSSIGIVSAADQRSKLASLPVGLLFLEPLGTKCQYDSEPPLQSNEIWLRKMVFLNIVLSYFVTVARHSR
jgi:hypothetical protein